MVEVTWNMSTRKRILLALALILSPICSWGQVSARVAGLEGNFQYMELLLQEQQLHRGEDSVMNVISQTRKLFASATSAEREQYGRDILRLEGELFDIRNRIGEVGNSINIIEQEYVLEHLDDDPVLLGTTSPSSVEAEVNSNLDRQVPNLIFNDYFKRNLSPADYSSLCRSQEREVIPPVLIDTYLDNYRQMEELADIYSTASRTEAEEAYSKLLTIRLINETLADSLARVWNYIYDNKVYAYSYLLDKMNQNGLLNDFERQFRETNQQIALARDKVASDVVYGYPLHKKLILSYEMALASILGYTEALDSLSRVLKEEEALDYNLPLVDPAPRNFIEYGDIEVTSRAKYNASNPIPQNEVFRYGTVYKIQVGDFVRVQPVSIFRNVSPLCYEKQENGRYIYYAGAFRELSEAQTAIEQLTKLGFRKPQIVVWRDGIFESLGEESASFSVGSTNSKSTFYRVEIDVDSEEMSVDVKGILSSAAPDKEVSRTPASDGGYIYTVGSFSDRESAERLVKLLGVVNGVTAKVLELKN